MTKKKDDLSCFVIMPISDQEGYPKDHFQLVYEDIIKPSCENAGFISKRADEVKETNLIHLDILKNIVEAPLAVCDLSSRNPNVMFELGIRQAFNKPVVLMQERGTPPIFDVGPMRYTEYSRDMKHRDVKQAIQGLTDSISATFKAKDDPNNINSIVNLLSMQAATIPEAANNPEMTEISLVRAEMGELKTLMNNIARSQRYPRTRREQTKPEYFLRRLSLLVKSDNNLQEKEEKLAELFEECSRELSRSESGYYENQLREVQHAIRNELMS